MIKVTASELIKYAFAESGLKTTFVAERYGISLSTLNTWKRGNFCPQYDDLYGLLEFMGFDLPELSSELRDIKDHQTMKV